MTRKATLFLLLALLLLLTTGCFWKKQVESNELGLVLLDGVSVERVEGPGRYTEWGWYADLKVIDMSATTVEWSDPDLVTNDKQPIGLKLAITYRRNPESAEFMWDTYRREAIDNEALQALVFARVPRAAKSTTARYTLDGILGIEEGSSREAVAEWLSNQLKPELAEVGVTLLDVGISDISVDEGYMEKLKAKAQAIIEKEVAAVETQRLQERLQQEIAQTDIELEVARRDQEVQKILAKTYEESPQALELKRLEMMGKVIGNRDKIFFIPEGTSLNLILGGDMLTSSGAFSPE